MAAANNKKGSLTLDEIRLCIQWKTSWMFVQRLVVLGSSCSFYRSMFEDRITMTRNKKWTHNENAGELWPCCGKPLGKYDDPGLHRCKPEEYSCTRCGGKMNLWEEMAPDVQMTGYSQSALLDYAKTVKKVRHIRGYLCDPPTTEF